MASEVIHVTVDEFANDLERFLERVIHGRETVVVENGEGERAEIRPAPAAKRRASEWRPSAAELEALSAAAGSWSDFDDEDFLRKVYESRDLPPRPRVEL